MTVIRVIFDGTAFIPQQPVSLPNQSEAFVLVDQTDLQTQAQLDTAIRAYYEGAEDSEDISWGIATGVESHRAWDED